MSDDDDPFKSLRPVEDPRDRADDGDRIVPFPPAEAYENEFVDEGSAPKRESRFYTAASLKGREVPQREWLVEGWVPSKTVTLFGGDGGTGKSLCALQLAVAAATGRKWLKHDVTAGPVIFISAEDDDDELHRRIHDIVAAERLDYDDLDRLTIRSLAGEDALLAVDSQVALMASELYRELDKRAEDDEPTLIVIDTLADVYPANENDRAKVRQFIGLLRGLALKRECSVVLLGHPSLTGLTSGSGTSGSTAWNNSVRSRLYLSRVQDDGYEPDPDARILSNKKANYGRVGAEIHIRWEAGIFVPEEGDSGLDRAASGAFAERVFMTILDAFAARGRYVSANPGPTFAPAVFEGHPQAEGCTKAAFKAAMERLFTRGDIEVSKHGPASKGRTHITRAKR